jgi:hypothetical protein
MMGFPVFLSQTMQEAKALKYGYDGGKSAHRMYLSQKIHFIARSQPYGRLLRHGAA